MHHIHFEIPQAENANNNDYKQFNSHKKLNMLDLHYTWYMHTPARILLGRYSSFLHLYTLGSPHRSSACSPYTPNCTHHSNFLDLHASSTPICLSGLLQLCPSSRSLDACARESKVQSNCTWTRKPNLSSLTLYVRRRRRNLCTSIEYERTLVTSTQTERSNVLRGIFLWLCLSSLPSV